MFMDDTLDVDVRASFNKYFSPCAPGGVPECVYYRLMCDVEGHTWKRAFGEALRRGAAISADKAPVGGWSEVFHTLRMMRWRESRIVSGIELRCPTNISPY